MVGGWGGGYGGGGGGGLVGPFIYPLPWMGGGAAAGASINHFLMISGLSLSAAAAFLWRRS